MKQIADQAIVLGRVDYGERDRILTLLSREHGKVSVLAKGVRSQKSRLAGGVELLSTSEVTYIDGKGSLKTLTGARLLRHYGSITSDMQRMQLAFEALRVVSKMCEDGAGEEHYEVLETLMKALDDASYDPLLVELWFGIKLLSMSGTFADISPDFDKDLAEPLFEFDHSVNQFVVRPGGAFTLNDLKLLRLSQTQPRPLKLQNPLGSEPRLVQLIKTLLKSNLTEV